MAIFVNGQPYQIVNGVRVGIDPPESSEDVLFVEKMAPVAEESVKVVEEPILEEPVTETEAPKPTFPIKGGKK